MTAAIDSTPNVMSLNKVIDKVESLMQEIKATAESAGIDLRPDIEPLERALSDFFTNRDEVRDAASDVLKGGE